MPHSYPTLCSVQKRNSCSFKARIGGYIITKDGKVARRRYCWMEQYIESTYSDFHGVLYHLGEFMEINLSSVPLKRCFCESRIGGYDLPDFGIDHYTDGIRRRSQCGPDPHDFLLLKCSHTSIDDLRPVGGVGAAWPLKNCAKLNVPELLNDVMVDMRNNPLAIIQLVHVVDGSQVELIFIMLSWIINLMVAVLAMSSTLLYSKIEHCVFRMETGGLALANLAMLVILDATKEERQAKERQGDKSSQEKVAFNLHSKLT
ncbi:uncharacterized protein BDR25DRAFT_353963 [Lindgomyces ingoldianus]|uniref:Uncharacterized protein n=1 Tax=Lindgomyces ingoldianus TaxID=673940 RepID=A0ACB6QZQ4_9PLEO|nr:uncharacterized protein BDR25DRAFT_353963 [Lindgomyces ingoldianus]KAF2472262.1 hypothetical protein BDR25DRAFT_353963 [Lindgomyces ingoldianus]